MVAGATGIDLFLLVVATDDGVMPQTREHLEVLEVLEVPAGVVALTKSDVAEPARLDAVAADVRALLAPSPYADAPLVPVSARRRTGLDALRAALDAIAAAAPRRRRREGAARLHVDRCFTLRGIGTVVTGTLWAGAVAQGQDVRIEPGARRARVRTVHVHDARVPAARAGERVALNLAGIERGQVQRGDVVVTAGAEGAVASHFVDASLGVLPGSRPLRRGGRVQVHHGTRDVPARVELLDADVLDPGREGLVQLRLEQALVPTAGDRFLVRGIAPPGNVGGGTVLDPRPRKHGRGAQHVRRLQAIASGDPLEALRLELEGARSGLGPEAGAPLLEALTRAGDAAAAGHARRRWFEPRALGQARGAVLEAVSESPAGPGAIARRARLDVSAVAAVLEDLATEGAVSERDGVFSLRTRAHALDDPLARELAAAVRADGLTPRAPDALAAAAGAERPAAVRALDGLAAAGVLVRLRPGVYIDPQALDRARHAVVAACERDGAVTIAGVRDALGTSRKLAQAILEHLDARRITRRRGDEHVLRSRASN
jgi:selenocysteine-specific elongation factor